MSLEYAQSFIFILAVCLSFRQRLEAFHSKVVYHLDVLLLECNKIFRFKKKITCPLHLALAEGSVVMLVKGVIMKVGFDC
jgi:hypothetical protein